MYKKSYQRKTNNMHITHTHTHTHTHTEVHAHAHIPYTHIHSHDTHTMRVSWLVRAQSITKAYIRAGGDLPTEIYSSKDQ